jgi:hypothetical protein
MLDIEYDGLSILKYEESAGYKGDLALSSSTSIRKVPSIGPSPGGGAPGSTYSSAHVNLKVTTFAVPLTLVASEQLHNASILK